MNVIKRWILARKLKNLKQKSDMEEFLEKELQQTTLEYTKSLRELEKQRKILEAQRRTRQIKRATEGLRDELDYDEDDEDDEDDDIDETGKTLLNALAKPLIQKFTNSNVSLSPNPNNVSEALPELPSNIVQKYNSLTPQQREQIKQLIED